MFVLACITLCFSDSSWRQSITKSLWLFNTENWNKYCKLWVDCFFFFWNLNNTSYMYSKIQNINACQQLLASWFSKRSTKIWKYIWCLKWGKITFLSFKVQLLANLAIPIGVPIFLQVLWGLRTLLAHKTITVYQ